MGESSCPASADGDEGGGRGKGGDGAQWEVLSELLNSAISNERLGLEELDEDEKIKVVMDYGGANVAKELHIGHLRSPVIGESLARLYKNFRK